MAECLRILAAGPWRTDQVRVFRQPAVDIPRAAEAEIDRLWRKELAAAKAENKKLFNGPILYLRDVNAGIEHLTLHLALADYKSFLVTTLRYYDLFARAFPVNITPALGNSVLLTCGNHLLLGVRSSLVAAYPGRAHLFGGVLEPPAHETGNHSLNNSSVHATHPLLDHLRRELHEELHLFPTDLIGTPRVMLLVQDLFLHQPELIWHWEISERFLQCGTPGKQAMDRHEHERIIQVKRMRAVDVEKVAGITLTPASSAAIDMLVGVSRQ